MKRSLADILIENSKVTKKVNGELATPSVDNIHTPDNHVGGKKSRTVDGKRGLGDRKAGKVSQVTPPKKGEKRKMKEDAARLASKGTPSTQGDGRTPAGKRSVPGELKNAKGNQKNRDEGIAKRKRMASPVVPSRSLEEGLGDNPDSKASMPFSKASNKDEGLKKPKVAKGKGVARGARIGTLGDNKKNPANIGKTRKMDKSYIGGVSAPVAKVKESLEDLADFLGTSLEINQSVVESNYPDGMDHSYLDDDGSDAAYDDAVDNMKYDVADFLKNEGPAYIADYQKFVNDPRAKDDTSWFDEHLAGLVEAAYEIAMAAFNVEGYDFEVDEDTLKPMLQQFMKQAGVAEEHIPYAFNDYMSEENVAENGNGNTLSNAQYLLRDKGYQVAGGGMTGGQMMFKNAEGNLATVDVHTWRPDEVVGWRVKGNGKNQEGRTVDELQAFLSQGAKTGSLFGRFRKKKAANEMSSGGAVGSAAIASGGGGQRPKGSLFADNVGEAHGTSKAYMDFTRMINDAEKEEHLYDLSVEFKKDRRLTHDEIDELDAAMYRKLRTLTNPAQQVATEDGGEVTSREIGGSLYFFGPEQALKDMQRKQGGRVGFSKNMDTWFYTNDEDEVTEDDPCWDSHEMVGMKNKGGRKVPNCVPKNESARYGRWS